MSSSLDFSVLPDVTELHPELSPDERWYAAHMKAREDAFAAIFGETEPPDQILSPSDPDLAVNWPGGGIYQFPPHGDRDGWAYVTHGLAQPMDPDDGASEPDDERVSGLGIELVLSTREPALWAPEVLLVFVRYLLFDERARPFLPGHRIPASVLSQLHPETELTHLLGVESTSYPARIALPAGFCLLVHLVGVTSAEVERARNLPDTIGSIVLAEVLAELGVGLHTDPARSCITKDPRFEAAWAVAAERHGSG